MGRKQDRFGLMASRIRLSAREMVDFDYTGKLDDEELDWLDQFSREYYRNEFKNTDDDFHPKQTSKRKRCYDATNARNRDIWSKFNREELAKEIGAEDEDDK